jgi:hypothetical protein
MNYYDRYFTTFELNLRDHTGIEMNEPENLFFPCHDMARTLRHVPA